VHPHSVEVTTKSNFSPHQVHSCFNTFLCHSSTCKRKHSVAQTKSDEIPLRINIRKSPTFDHKASDLPAPRQFITTSTKTSVGNWFSQLITLANVFPSINYSAISDIDRTSQSMHENSARFYGFSVLKFLSLCGCFVIKQNSAEWPTFSCDCGDKEVNSTPIVIVIRLHAPFQLHTVDWLILYRIPRRGWSHSFHRAALRAKGELQSIVGPRVEFNIHQALPVIHM
jgi:hypothetical protein